MIAVRRDAGGQMTVPGMFPIHDLVDLAVYGVPDGPYATVAALVLEQLGRLPDRPGDEVEVAGWRFTVTAVAHHAITEIHIQPAKPTVAIGGGRPTARSTAQWFATR